jgi:Flp pilus assembly protein TadG
VRLRKIHRDVCGASAVEFALTAPIFFLIIFGIIEGGLLVWTQLGLQHGAELAARCAGVNKTLCGTSSAIQNYAAQQSYGLNPSPSTFSVSAAACGQLVTASYTFRFITTYWNTPNLALTAQACFPT